MIKKIFTKRLERNLGFKIQKKVYCMAVDTATKSGIAIVFADYNKTTIETFTMKLPALHKSIITKEEKYEEHLKLFYKLVVEKLEPKTLIYGYPSALLILENSFLKMNVVTFGFLRALQGIVYAKLFEKFGLIKIIFPKTARKLVGFQSSLSKGSKNKDKKKEIMKWISNVVEEKITDDNEADALMLAFAGLKE